MLVVWTLGNWTLGVCVCVFVRWLSLTVMQQGVKGAARRKEVHAKE